MEGIEFVNILAVKAEEVNHHPDLEISWCRVKVTYTSHDQGGVTQQCISMAKMVEDFLLI
jgi:4a-hydroxytetrahydrobiopterin dehydratase